MVCPHYLNLKERQCRFKRIPAVQACPEQVWFVKANTISILLLMWYWCWGWRRCWYRCWWSGSRTVWKLEMASGPRNHHWAFQGELAWQITWQITRVYLTNKLTIFDREELTRLGGDKMTKFRKGEFANIAGRQIINPGRMPPTAQKSFQYENLLT